MEISALPFVLAVAGSLGVSVSVLLGLIISDRLGQRSSRASCTSIRSSQTNSSPSEQHAIAA